MSQEQETFRTISSDGTPRVYTREELIRLGAISVSPERDTGKYDSNGRRHDIGPAFHVGDEWIDGR